MSADWPKYCCAFLRDAKGRYLLERRPDHEVEITGRLTCFGGERHTYEHPDDCIRRELLEELGCAAEALRLRLRLLGAGGQIIAWFYEGLAPPAEHIHTEPGVELRWAEPVELPDLPLGSWNRAAFIAIRSGSSEAIVDDP